MSKQSASEWATKSLEGCINIQAGFPFPSAKFKTDGRGFPLVRIRDLHSHAPEICVDELPANEFRVRRGDLLVGMDGDFSIVKWRGRDSALNQRVCKVAGGASLATEYLFYLLSNELPKIHSQTGATTVKHLSNKDLESIVAYLPPLAEQKKIAEILSSVDEVIENTESEINKLEDLKKATLNELLTKGIGHTEFKDSEIGRIPKSWSVGDLRALGTIVTGATPNTSNRELYGGRVMFASPSDLGDKAFIYSTEKTISDVGLRSIRAVPQFSVMVVCIGSTIGKVGITTAECATNQQINTLIPENCNYLFAYYLLKFCERDIRAASGTQAVPLLNKTEFSKLRVRVPPLREQDLIGETLLSIDERSSELNEKKNVSERLKKALMQDLLTGKVRVKVN